MTDAISIIGLLLVIVVAQILAYSKGKEMISHFNLTFVRLSCQKRAAEAALGLFLLLVALLMAITHWKWFTAMPFDPIIHFTVKYIKPPTGRSDLWRIYEIINQILVGAVFGIFLVWLNGKLANLIAGYHPQPPDSRTTSGTSTAWDDAK